MKPVSQGYNLPLTPLLQMTWALRFPDAKKSISWGACQNTESWVPPSRDSCSGTVEPGICLVILRQVFSGHTWSYRNEFHLLILTGLTQNHNTAFSIFKKFLCSIVDLQYCVKVSRVQQSDSVIYIFFQIIFRYRLLQDIKHNSLCYTIQ